MQRYSRFCPYKKRIIAKWTTDDLTGLIKCSNCGNDAPCDTTGGGQYKSRFCPSCGAEMNKCGDCNIREDFAKTFDLHWHDEEDCPYACPVKKEAEV